MLLHAQNEHACLLERAPRTAPSVVASTRTGARTTSDPPQAIRCAACGNPVTGSEHRCSINGSHRHTFANPHGLVYRIGCFAAAPGCSPQGPACWEFTWFAGFAWTVEQCVRCGTHLGWWFSSSMHSFHGLVYDRLVDSTDSQASGS